MYSDIFLKVRKTLNVDSLIKDFLWRAMPLSLKWIAIGIKNKLHQIDTMINDHLIASEASASPKDVGYKVMIALTKKSMPPPK